MKKSHFPSSNAKNHVKLMWEVYVETKDAQVAQDENCFFVLLDSRNTCGEFLEYIKEEYYPKDTHE